MNSTATYDHSNSHDWVYDFVSVMNTPVVLDPLDSSQTLGSPEILSELEGDQAYLTTPQADGEAPVQKKRKSGGTFQCLEETCGKTFTQQAHLSIHMRKHTGERPYVCNSCSKSFTQLGNLKTHERKHTGERPFKCKHEGCGKMFSQMGNMKTHMQLHSGVRPYPCRQCDKSFMQLGNLKSHLIKLHSEKPPSTEENLLLGLKRRIRALE